MPNVSRLTNYKWVEPLCSQPELYTRNDHIYENPWLWRHTCIKCESERLKSFQLQTQTRACGAGAGDTTGNKGLNSMWIQQLSKINNTVKVDLLVNVKDKITWLMASDDDGQSHASFCTSCRNVRGGRRFCSAFFLRYTNTASTAGALCSAAELWPCRHTVCAAATIAGALQSQSKVIILISLFVPIVELMPKCNNLSLYAFQDKEARHRNGPTDLFGKTN